jgi:tetratricopeptide (TPR) repeat protein
MARQEDGDTEPVGRAGLLDRLGERWAAADRGGAPLTLLVGGLGVGKSTVLQASLSRARRAGLRVLEAQALPMEVAPPYLLLQQLLRARPSTPPPSGGRVLEGSGPLALGWVGAERPTEELPPLALGVLGKVPPPEDPRDREARLLEAISTGGGRLTEERLELYDQLSSFLEDLAEGGRLLLGIDDLNLADEASLEFLAHLARRAGEGPLRLLATVLPEPEWPPRLREVLTSLESEGLLQREVLPPLTEAETGALLRRWAGGRPVPEELITQWHTLSEGNPLFLQQMVQREPSGSPPPSLGGGPAARRLEFQQLLRRRLGELPPEERRVVSYASVLGRQFPFARLRSSTGMPEEPLAEAVEALVRRGLLRERGGEVLEFTDEELREEVYASLTEVRRRLLHRRVAEATLAEEDPPSAAGVPELAYHFDRAGEDAPAAAFHLKAARLAARASQPALAVEHLRRAWDCQRRLADPGPGSAVNLLAELALQLDQAGDPEQAISLLKRELDPNGQEGRTWSDRDRATLTLVLCRLNVHQGDLGEAERLVRQVLQDPTLPEDPARLANAHRLAGQVAYYRGDYATSLSEAQASVEGFLRAGLPLEAARSRVALANALAMLPQGREQDPEALYDTAAQELEGMGDLGQATLASVNLGIWCLEAKGAPEARSVLERALTLAKRTQDPRVMGWVEFNLADVLLRMGEPDRAQELNRSAGEHLRRVGDRIGLLQVGLLRGRLLARAGSYTEAESILSSVQREARELSLGPDELEALLRLAEVDLLRGDLSRAGARLEEVKGRGLSSLRPDLVREVGSLEERLRAGSPTG